MRNNADDKNRQRNITVEIREHIGIIARRNSGWNRELNLVSWNGQEPAKYDIRDWSEDHSHMSKGITLFRDEMQKLVDVYIKNQNQKICEPIQQENELGERTEDWSSGGMEEAVL